MTFKHAKFADSVVMRSLEKVAFEKGLVKADEVVKTAAKQVDFRPTPDLFLNLLKLSEGLRSAGLDKHANELEKRAFAYKQAQTMYDTHGEKGEDLIEFAHPKGSHKLEDVDGNEAVFETILDQHLKSVDMVNKKPTGKLASSRDILGAVKQIIGQKKALASTNDILSLMKESAKIITKALAIAESTGGLYDISINQYNGWRDTIVEYSNNPSINMDMLKDAESKINAMVRNLTPNLLHNYVPDFLNKGISDDTVWEKIKGLLGAAKQKVIEAKGKLIALVTGDSDSNTVPDPEKVPAVPGARQMQTIVDAPMDRILSKIKPLISKIQAWKIYSSIQKYPQAIKWIDSQSSTLQSIFDKFNALSEEQKQDQSNNDELKRQIDKQVSDINNFENNWVKPRNS